MVVCQYLTCTFTTTSTDPDGSIEDHLYEFGDGTIGTGQIVSHVYAAPGGTFPVTLTVTDNEGLSAAITREVVAVVAPPAPNRPPEAIFTSACSELTCFFADASWDPDSGDAIVSREWQFGDGQSATGAVWGVRHDYAGPAGVFDVRLIVRDILGAADTLTRGVQVGTPPAPPPPPPPPPQPAFTRPGSYARETAVKDPTHDFTWVLHENRRFEIVRPSDPTTVVHAGSFRSATTWLWVTIPFDEIVIFEFDAIAIDQFCGSAYGVFFEIGGATHMAVSLCAPAQAAGLEEGFHVAPAGPPVAAGPPPQSGRIAFVRDGKVHAVSAEGTGLVQLTNGPSDAEPAWSPDGNRIAFARGTGETGIYVVNADGTGLARLTTNGRAPSWSPDGGRLVFECNTSGSLGICTIEVDNPLAVVEAIPGTGQGQFYGPAWSPDGSRIVHTSDWLAFDFAFDLWTMAPDGSNRVVLTPHTNATPNPWLFHQPAWSPDGQRLALITCPAWSWNHCSSSTISVMNADGSGLTWLAVATGFASPTWSPDGQVIAFGSGKDIDWVSADGSQRGRIIANGHSPSWRP